MFQHGPHTLFLRVNFSFNRNVCKIPMLCLIIVRELLEQKLWYLFFCSQRYEPSAVVRSGIGVGDRYAIISYHWGVRHFRQINFREKHTKIVTSLTTICVNAHFGKFSGIIMTVNAYCYPLNLNSTSDFILMN